MPFIIPFIPLIAAGIGGTMTGMQMAGVGQPSPHEQMALQDEQLKKQQAATDANNNQLQSRAAQSAATQYAPNVQAQLGGAVSPDYYAQTVAAQTGYGGQLDAVRQALAQQGIAPMGGGSSSGLTPSSLSPQSGSGSIPDISQYLNGGGNFHGA